MAPVETVDGCDDGAVRPQQDIEFRQIPVHDAGAQHAHHFHQQGCVVRARLLGRERHVVQPRGRIAVLIGHQLHQQDAVMEVDRLGHPHAGRREPVERIDLGALPGRLLRLAAEAGALGHRAGLPGVLDLAVLGVVDRLPKAALRGFLVDLGAERFAAAAHDEDRRLLAAHQLAHHRVDQALFDQ